VVGRLFSFLVHLFLGKIYMKTMKGEITMVIGAVNLIDADRIATLLFCSIWDGTSGHVLQTKIQ
jgi:hypothetical protein